MTNDPSSANARLLLKVATRLAKQAAETGHAPALVLDEAWQYTRDAAHAALAAALTANPPDPAEVIRASWDVLCPGLALPTAVVTGLAEAGWGHAEIERLYEFAIARPETGWASLNVSARASDPVRVARRFVEVIALRLLPAGCGIEECFLWLAALDSAPDLGEYNRVAEVTGQFSDAAREPRRELLAWRAVLPGALGPLSVAAGLDLVEAHRRNLRGELAEEDLRTLAALRGYRFDDI